MTRTPARFTQADLNRAAKVAVENDLRVRVTTAGEIILERPTDKPPQVDSQQSGWAM